MLRSSPSLRAVEEPTPASALRVPLVVDSPAESRAPQPVTVGLPFPRGRLVWPHDATLTDAAKILLPCQAEPLAYWADGSVRWLLVDTVAGDLRSGANPFCLAFTRGGPRTDGPMCESRAESGGLTVRTGAAEFRIRPGDFVSGVECDGRLVATPLRLCLTDARGRVRTARTDRTRVEAAGPVRVTVCHDGTFPGAAPLQFVMRLCFFAGTGLVRVRLTLHNPRRARHSGGLWDLGDQGSILFRDLSLDWGLADARASAVKWRSEPGGSGPAGDTGPVEIYQDSSGGVNWDSRNHVNRDGRVPCSFRGYRVRAGASEFRGLRASPVVTLRGPAAALTVAVPEFWQQFPKAVEAADGVLRVRLFPGQFGDLHELQGGEQKTHTVWLQVGSAAAADPLSWVQAPAAARAKPEWYANSGVFPHLSPAHPSHPGQLDDCLRPAVDGEHSLVARREMIDEYGWRNFGELYADHENAYYRGPKPVVSHYNNQYDGVYGALLQYFRTGDRRWWEVADPLARHVADIDIYHTTEDKAAYNGGLFWFTDHYTDAATCTHRTYSQANRPADGQPYGGGPGSCHNFTTGLTTYYYLTGDPVARDAAVGLADWVVAMDDGARNVLWLIDDGPTGLASFTSEPDYHGPGRGPGLSINALLDGWELTGRRAYLDKAEELVRRCVHPADDIDSRDLLNVERRWSYTIFFVALDRYLAAKADAAELDDRYAYARACLLHYAAWMVEHEGRYLDHPEKLEFPTEAWAAQEFRKANVLRLAAAHADEPLRGRLLARGQGIADRAWEDLLAFPSRHVARAIAIVMTEGTRDDWFRRYAPAAAARPAAAAAEFPPPRAFSTQKRRVADLLWSARGLGGLLWRLSRPSVWRRASAGAG
jgi:hypothetical protein